MRFISQGYYMPFKFTFLLVVFIIVFLVLGVEQVLAKEDRLINLSFVKAVHTALLNNPDIIAAEADLENKAAIKQKAMASFMPVVDFYTDYLTGDAPSASLFTSIDKRKLEAGTDFNDPGNFRNFESGIKAHMTIFNGGKNHIANQVAYDFLAAARSAGRAVVNKVVAKVMDHWFKVISAGRFIKISEETVETIEKQLDIMSVKFRGGSVLKSDILSLKVRLAEAEEEMIQNKSRLSLAKASLAVLLGLSPESELIIDTKGTDFKNFAAITKELLKNDGLIRPEVLQADKMLSGTKKTAIIAKRMYLPSVHIAGKYYLDDEEMNYNHERENWSFGVMVNWNLFSGFSNTADRKKAAADLKTARQASRKTGLSVQLDVKKSALMLEEASARLEVSAKKKELAEESLWLVKKQYEGGSVTITRYLDAELAFSKAKTGLATALCDRMSAVVETSRAKGLLADPCFVIEASFKEPGVKPGEKPDKESDEKPDEKSGTPADDMETNHDK